MRKTLPIVCVAAMAGILWAWLSFDRGNRPPPSLATSAVPATGPRSRIAPLPQSPPVAASSALPTASQPADPIAAFAAWLERYRTAPASLRTRLLEEGEKLARQRKSSLYRLIAENPAAALASAINEPSRRLLPDAIATLLEHPASSKGDFVVIEDDSPHAAGGAGKIYRQAQIDGQTFDAYVYGRRSQQLTKYGTSLIGITLADRMAVLEQPVRLVSADDLPEGAKLEAPLIDPAHPEASQVATGAHVVQVAGHYYPVCCAEHAQQIAAGWVTAEDRPGPIVQALGGSLPGLAATQATATLAASHQLGPQSVLVIVADFSDAPGRPVDVLNAQPYPSITSDLINQRIAVEAADFYTQASYGKTTIGSTTVTGVVRLQNTLASYSTNGDNAGLKNDALAAAASAGFTPSNYDRTIVIFASTHGIPGDKLGWSGLAELGGSFAWFNGNCKLGVAAHELGHTYGLSHAQLWQIPNGKTDPVDAGGAPLDYGDPFDIMGGAIGDAAVQPDPPNPWYLNNLGWLPDSAVLTVDANNPQPYRIYRFDHQSASFTHPLALRINRNEGTDYWVAYRRKYFNYSDSSLADMGLGAYVFWAINGNPSSQLIDIDTPGTNAKDASLNIGHTFTDATAGITLQVVQSGGSSPDEYLEVQVTFQSRIAFQHKINNVDEKSGSITLTVERLNSSVGAISAHYTTVPGTAVAGTNYTTTSGTLNWQDGDMNPKTIQIPILIDGSTAQGTSFTVAFDPPNGFAFPNGTSATVNIQKTGAADSLFVHPFLTSSINALALQPDGHLVIGGNFSNSSAPVTSSGIGQLQSSGALDTAFDQGVGVSPLPVKTLARQPDGKILVSGSFTSIRGVARNRIARLLPNGSLDLTFDPGTGPGNNTASRNVIHAITVQPDGKILVGGEFTTWNGATHMALVRLNEDGTLDATFASFGGIVSFFSDSQGVEANVQTIALQPIASSPCFSIVVGGLFYRQATGGSHGSIVRLNADGTRDTSFDAAGGASDGVFVSQVTSLALQIDGKIVVGGQFTAFNGATAHHLARLNNSGTNDSAFVTGLGAGLSSTQALCDVVCLRLQPDGGILTGGYFEKAVNTPQGIARFGATGIRDTSFMPVIEASWVGNGVTCMDMAPDNTLYIGLNNSGANPNVAKHLFTGVGALSGVVQFASAGSFVAEGTTAAIAVDRTGGSAGKVSVNYQTVGRSAVAGTNFTSSCGTLTWNDGDSASKIINVPTILNGTTDPDLVFEIHLGIPLGSVSLGQRAVTNVTIQDTATANVPKVNFASAASSFTESNSTAMVTVTISQPHTDTIVVPVTASASSGKNYTIDTTPLTFASGVTSQDITITLKEDLIVEGNVNVALTLHAPTSGNAFLGTTTQHTLTINDDDVKPSFTTPPANTMASVGTAGVSFHSVAAGNPFPTSQWYKNTIKITTAATGPDYSLNNLQLTQAGQYSVIATNPFGTATAIAELGVVDTTPRTVNVTANSTATLTVTTAGNLLSYAWTKGGGGVTSPPRITASGKSLVIKTATSATDAGVYTCNVSNPGGTPVPVLITLNVIDNKPVVTNTVKMDDGIVSGTYHPYTITVNTAANLTPTSYSASGLPAGLSCNAVTGIISGKPIMSTKGLPVNITLKATNAMGTGTAIVPLTIFDMTTNTVGSYMGPVDRNAAINSNLGGRIDLAVTGTGAYTGTLTLGPAGYAFKGVLETSLGTTTALGDTTLTIASKASAHLTFTIDAVSSSITAGAVAANSASLGFTAWRSTTPTNTRTGYQTFSLKIDSLLAGNDTYPQGLGYGSFTVPITSSSFTVAGLLADGTGFTGSSSLGPLGEILVYQCLYTGTRGSILGQLKVSPGSAPAPLNTDSMTTGTLSWSRPAITGRTYATGFTPINLTADGGRIDATKTGVLPTGFSNKTSNASLTFTQAHVGDDSPAPDLIFTLNKGGGATVPGLPNRTTFSLTASTGAFSGTFTQTAPTRSGAYKGMLVNHAGTVQGDGWFTLPQLLPTPATSAILSGQVNLVNKP